MWLTYLHNYLFSSNYTGQFNPYSIVKADTGFALTVFKGATFKLQTEAGFSIGADSVPFLDFVLGGYGFIPLNNFKPFYGYDFLTLAGNSYLKASATIDYEIFKKNHLNIAANFANVADNLYETTDWFSQVKYSGYALGYGLETIVGPIEFKYSWSPELNKGFAWFSVGFWF